MHGFRSTGPYRDLPAYDDIIQAASGVGGQQEWLHGEPTYMATAIGDKVSGMTGALAITAALHKRAVTGVGSVIEVPMAENLAAFGVLEHLWGRTFVPPRGEARYPRMSSTDRHPYQTSDGWLAVMVYTDDNWRRFFALIGRPELAGEERFATLKSRTEHLDELLRLVADVACHRHDRGVVRAIAGRADPRGAVQPRRRPLRRRAPRGRGVLGDDGAPDRGDVAAGAHAHHVRRRTTAARRSGAAAGADTEAVLAELDDEI